MKLITCQGGRLLTLGEMAGEGQSPSVTVSADVPTFSTELPPLDALAPGGALRRGVVHEILSEPADGSPLFFAALLARSCAAERGAVVWCDPEHKLYPPALAAQGINLGRLFLLQ